MGWYLCQLFKNLQRFTDPLSLHPQGTVIWLSIPTLLLIYLWANCPYWSTTQSHCSLRMETEWVTEMSEVFKLLTQLSAHEDFIQFSRCESLKTYIYSTVTFFHSTLNSSNKIVLYPNSLCNSWPTFIAYISHVCVGLFYRTIGDTSRGVTVYWTLLKSKRTEMI
jgi:hypothetical protein